MIEAHDIPLMMPGTEPDLEEEVIFKEDVIVDMVDYSVNMEEGPSRPPEPDHPEMEDRGHMTPGVSQTRSVAFAFILNPPLPSNQKFSSVMRHLGQCYT